MQNFIKYVRHHIVTSILLTINFLMVIIVLLMGGFNDNLVKLGAMVPFLVSKEHEYYRLIMMMFLHANIIHFLSNAIVLFFLGSQLERLLGPVRYLVLYFFSGITSSLTILFFSPIGSVTVGASGAIFGIMGALLVLTFKKPNWFTAQGIKSIRQLMVLNLVFTFLINEISVEGHIGGLIGGTIIVFLLIPEIPYFIRKHPLFIEQHQSRSYDA